MVLALLFSLFLPLITFSAGAYLVYRGLRRMSPSGAIRGKMRIPNPIESPASKRLCAYSRVVVDYYAGGHTPWRNIYSAEKKTNFSVGGKEVDATHADFRLLAPYMSRGHVAPRGLVSELKYNLRQVGDFMDILAEVGPKEILDQPMLDAIMENEAAKKKIRPFLSKPLRILEYLLEEGAEISIATDPATSQAGGTIRGTESYPLLITNAGEEAASSSMREKAYLSLFVGAALLAASFLLFIYILVWAP